MISRVSGTLRSVSGGCATLDVDALGVTIEVMVASYLIEGLEARVGQTISLHTMLQFEPVGQSGALAPRLIGFEESRDRSFYTLFTTVKGVGGKRALKAMAEPASVIAGYIASRDHKALQGLPEIGKRLAETIVAELHGKVDGFVSLDVHVAGQEKGSSTSSAVGQAIDALVRLGESRGDAEQKVRRAADRDSELTSAEQLLSAALSQQG